MGHHHEEEALIYTGKIYFQRLRLNVYERVKLLLQELEKNGTNKDHRIAEIDEAGFNDFIYLELTCLVRNPQHVESIDPRYFKHSFSDVNIFIIIYKILLILLIHLSSFIYIFIGRN